MTFSPLLLFLLCFHYTAAQGLFSLAQSFLGSGLQGNNGGGGFLGNHGAAFGGLLQNFANTGNGAGPGSNLPFGEFFKMAPGLLGGHGAAAHGNPFQHFMKPPPPAARPAPVAHRRPAPAPAASLVPESSDYNEPLPTGGKKKPQPAPAPKPWVAPKAAKKIPEPIPQGADYDDIDYALTGANPRG